MAENQTNDLSELMSFLKDRFQRWGEVRVITPEVASTIIASLDANEARLRQLEVLGSKPSIVLPADAESRRIALLQQLQKQIQRESDAGRLPLSQAHEAEDDVRSELSPLTRRRAHTAYVSSASNEEPVDVLPVEGEPMRLSRPKVRPPRPPRRPILEIILDPRSIQWLLILGGALIVIGLVSWLYAVGVFESKPVLAVVLATINLIALASGLGSVRFTRFRVAGLALTFLACLVMPLNLWFYEFNRLITVESGLWIPALVISGLYLLASVIVRDARFVYVLMGGITLTALLLLARVHALYEIATVTTTLLAMALVSIHLERAFPEGDGPFTRRRFGMAFFWSGHVQLLGGLLLLLCGQIMGNMPWDQLFPGESHMPWNRMIDVVANPQLRWLAIGVVMAAAYAYLYSDLVVRRLGLYLYAAMACVVWAEALVLQQLDLWHVRNLPEIAIAVLAITALLVTLIRTASPGNSLLVRVSAPLGVLVSILPLALGVLLHIRNTMNPESASWIYVGAMAVLIVCSRIAAHVWRNDRPDATAIYIFVSAGALIAGFAGLLLKFHIVWPEQAPWLALVPIGYLLASTVYRGHFAEQPLRWVSHTAIALLFLATGPEILNSFLPRSSALFNPNLSHLEVALFLGLAAVFYGLLSVLRRQALAVYAATLFACLAVLQIQMMYEVKPEIGCLIFAVLGVALLLGYRLALLDRLAAKTNLPRAAYGSANALLTVAFAASFLIMAGELAQRQPGRLPSLLEAQLGLIVAGLLAVWLDRQPGWRRWYVTAIAGQIIMAVLSINVFSDLEIWQKLEIMSVTVGFLLLVLGHIGLYRERDRESDLISFAFFLGTALMCLPLAAAVLYYRGNSEFVPVQELPMLVTGILLLATGFMFQIRSTTLGGAGLLTVYVVTLLMFLRHALDKLSSAALALLIGGSVIFLLGLLLSVFRPFLMKLPERIRKREGIFRVLAWR